ncbi:hypothetical protein AB0O34_20430 [Sphaerisporangium sp. NPDC088356]|uniref:PIN-like domain-containing protein n=1 Tax=Sphaerisporangium sp. NPDC088356 TaxID=3154871 RepID=UPI003434AF89
MSSESRSTTSEPPPASSWATPPEFYLDENSVSRSVRKLLSGLGYQVHTPAELFGSRDKALGAPDDQWLPMVGQRGWVVIASDIASSGMSGVFCEHWGRWRRLTVIRPTDRESL